MGEDEKNDPLSLGKKPTMNPRRGDSLGRIDKYELVRELGEGGFGAVYLARDTVAKTEVAIKGLPPEIKHNNAELEGIRANFALVKRLRHPNIVAVTDLHLAQSVSYATPAVSEKLRVFERDTMVVMDYAPGVTLSQWSRQFPGGRVPVGRALAVVRQIAAALDYAHARKVLHRDVKPANVMVETSDDGGMTVRVLDFGLAAEIRSSMGHLSREIRGMSGTPPYMAPEQWLGKKQGPATDQYSLATIFLELVDGEVPFASVFACGDSAVMRLAVTKDEPEIPEELPKKMRRALAKALAKKPEERFASCSEFVDALEGKVKVSRGGGGMAALAAAALAIAALAGAGWFAWMKYGGQTTPRPRTSSSLRSSPSKAKPNPPALEETQKAVNDSGRELKVPAETVVPDVAPAAPTASSSSPKTVDTNIVAVSNEHAISSSPEEVAPPKPAVRKFKPYTGPTREYVVRAGDTFLKIARGNGITLPQLVQLNNGLNVYDIQEGQKLRVPAETVVPDVAPAAPTASSSSPKTVDTNIVAVSNEHAISSPPEEVPPPKPAVREFKPYTGPTREYVVKAGDSFGSIALGNGITLRQLRQLNGLDSDVIRVGQKLKVPARKVISNPVPVSSTTSSPEEETTYIVQRGDYLAKIAKKFGVRVSSIKQLNNMKSDAMRVGQELKIPGKNNKVTEP